MTYSACDYMDDICGALGVDWDAVPADHDDDNDGPSEGARQSLAIIAKMRDELMALRIVAGIRKAHTHEEAAQNGLTLLLAARRCFREAKADKTLGRLASTISSAKGAVRMAGMRDRRAETATAEHAQTQEKAP